LPTANISFSPLNFTLQCCFRFLGFYIHSTFSNNAFVLTWLQSQNLNVQRIDIIVLWTWFGELFVHTWLVLNDMLFAKYTTINPMIFHYALPVIDPKYKPLVKYYAGYWDTGDNIKF